MKRELFLGLAALLILESSFGLGKIHADEPAKNQSIEKKSLEYKISKSGIDLIKKFEGYSAKKYLDVAGRPTIGYGHLIKEKEEYSEISKEKAEILLREDILFAENAVQSNVKVLLRQEQYDALVSFTYNLGAKNFQDSTLLKKLNSGNYDSVASEFSRWIYAGGKKVKGLENRRNKEAELFRGLKP